MARLKEALDAPTYADVGRALGLTTSAYANRKKADSIPYETLVPLAHSRKLSLEWLLFGEGSATVDRDTQARPVPEVDNELMTRAIVAIARHMGAAKETMLDVGKWSGLASLVYNKAVHVAPQLRISMIEQLAGDFSRAAKVMDNAGAIYSSPIVDVEMVRRVQEEPGKYDAGTDDKPRKPGRKIIQ